MFHHNKENTLYRISKNCWLIHCTANTSHHSTCIFTCIKYTLFAIRYNFIHWHIYKLLQYAWASCKCSHKKNAKPCLLFNLLDHFGVLGFDNDRVVMCMSGWLSNMYIRFKFFSKLAFHDDDCANYIFYVMQYLSVVNQSC